MIHPDIEKAIRLIDQKITELNKAKMTLLEAFGEKPTLQGNRFTQSSSPRFIRIPKKSSKLTRREAIIKLLKEEGPLSRSEILKKTSFPRGTIAFVLNDKDMFFSKDGLWHLAGEQEKQGDEEEKGLTPVQ